ncbi:response regulator transcription factor [Flectobacillus major]|uniref:response regulator transcription factor n=1 Tax=Flectobacillus major TaxID=103 RepID=UPI0003F8E555|nr:response regulator transcription factor [Flectobacillus major]
MKLLIIEDEIPLLESIIHYFGQEGHICEIAPNWETAMEKVQLYEYDCIVVDINLPDGNGLSIIRHLKKELSEVGIIIISAQNALNDRLVGLELGADDYLTKPFHLAELNARIKSIIRRRNFQGNTSITFEEIVVWPSEMLVTIHDKTLILTKKEFDLLMYLIVNKNKVLTKTAIAENLWGDSADMLDNHDFIYTHIKNLRKKMLESGGNDYIQSVYGMGYKFGK